MVVAGIGSPDLVLIIRAMGCKAGSELRGIDTVHSDTYDITCTPAHKFA